MQPVLSCKCSLRLFATFSFSATFSFCLTSPVFHYIHVWLGPLWDLWSRCVVGCVLLPSVAQLIACKHWRGDIASLLMCCLRWIYSDYLMCCFGRMLLLFFPGFLQLLWWLLFHFFSVTITGSSLMVCCTTYCILQAVLYCQHLCNCLYMEHSRWNWVTDVWS